MKQKAADSRQALTTRLASFAEIEPTGGRRDIECCTTFPILTGSRRMGFPELKTGHWSSLATTEIHGVICRPEMGYYHNLSPHCGNSYAAGRVARFEKTSARHCSAETVGKGRRKFRQHAIERIENWETSRVRSYPTTTGGLRRDTNSHKFRRVVRSASAATFATSKSSPM